MTFNVVTNPVTGEYGVFRQPADGRESTTVADLYARPGAAVVGEHVHPRSSETFTVVRGRLGLLLDGREDEARAGRRVSVPPGTPHDWWNAGTETAWVIVEVSPGGRFEELIHNLFFLAADGRTDSTGRPGLLQAALLAQEFDDTTRFVRPPRVVQKILFGALAPIARWRGLRGSYPEYVKRTSAVLEEIEALPAEILQQLPDGVPAGTLGKPPLGAY